MAERDNTPQCVIAAEIFEESDLWDLDDFGIEAANNIIRRLDEHGFVIVRKPSEEPHAISA